MGYGVWSLPHSPAFILSALVLLVLSQFCIHLINASTATFKEHVDRETSNPNDNGGNKVRRTYKLYSRCSNNYVQILGRTINAFGPPNSEHAGIRVESYSFGSLVQIQSATSLNYLCFDKKGRLIIRHSGKSMRCVFKEIHTPDHFTEFQSAANELWYIGFRRNGKPLKGFKWQQHRRKRKNRQRQRRLRHRQNKGKRTRERRSTKEQQARQAQRRKTCYQFTKRHISYAVESNGFLPGADFGQLVPQNRGTT